jgi:hypothetical protein
MKKGFVLWGHLGQLRGEDILKVYQVHHHLRAAVVPGHAEGHQSMALLVLGVLVARRVARQPIVVLALEKC